MQAEPYGAKHLRCGVSLQTGQHVRCHGNLLQHPVHSDSHKSLRTTTMRMNAYALMD
jgi:hypothetical protein